MYRRDGRLLRQVNRSFAGHWDRLITSGFLADLVARGWLVPFTIEPLELAADPAIAHAVIAPQAVEFVSYPFEWTFGQLKDAALRTLDLQAAAHASGFTLKDASAYNIQFHDGSPVMIDTLSFEVAEPGAPWIGYRQFCEHFLGPLALMAKRDIRLGLLLRPYLDGVPLDLVSRLLPGRTWLDFGLMSHLRLHARAQRRSGDDGAPATGPSAKPRGRMSDLRLAALVDSLRSTVRKLRWEPGGTEWVDYADHTSYTPEAAASKDRIVEAMLRASPGTRVWDLGANTGRFSGIAADAGKHVVAFDIDPGAAELHYRAVRRDGLTTILPLVADIANPSPGLGWAGMERRSLADRASADTILALALVHHLAIARNVPLSAIADWFARLAPEAIVEFVPKGDPMVDRLLATREDVFPEYTHEGFHAALSSVYEVLEEAPVEHSTRILFRLRRRAEPTPA